MNTATEPTIGRYFALVVVRIFLEQVLNAESHRIRKQHLGDLLRSAWILHGQASNAAKGCPGADQEHHDAHHHILGNGKIGVRRVNVKRLQQRERRAAEMMIRELR